MMNDSSDLPATNTATTTNTTTFNETNTDDFKFQIFGTFIYPSRWLSMPDLNFWLGHITSLAMIIGCVLPYVPQYLSIRKNHDCKGFSTFVCLTLLLANILRIAFWFGHPFEEALLIQSFLMILAQIFLLELCVRTKRQSASSAKRSLFGDSPRYFWRWTNLISYLVFLCFITAIIGAAMYFLSDCELFVETVGYLALVMESMLGLPQVIRNYRKKSVEGMSVSMVLMWLGGDTFKTGYFIAKNVPFQFWLCGLIQISIDLLILFQVCLYRPGAPTKKSYNIVLRSMRL